MDSDETILKDIHKAIIRFDKRAERSSEEVLVATFVDSEPLLDLLSTRNNQVIYGRRGTGKTHALKYLAEKVSSSGDLPIYLDLRSAGSNGSVYGDQSRSLAERASTLIIDVLAALKDELFRIAVQQIDTAPNPEAVTIRLDDFSEAISRFKVDGSAEQQSRVLDSSSSSTQGAARLDLEKPNAQLSVKGERDRKSETEITTTKSGKELVSLNFGSVMTSLTGLLGILGSARVGS